MADNTDHLSEVVQGIVDVIRQADLGLQDVWYGDQENIPRTPALAVEGIDKNRELAGVPLMTENTFQIALMIYHAKLQDTQMTRKQCDEFAEQVEDKLHEDVTLGGLVIWGFCRKVESGYAQRRPGLMFASRITWEGLTKTGVGM